MIGWRDGQAGLGWIFSVLRIGALVFRGLFHGRGKDPNVSGKRMHAIGFDSSFLGFPGRWGLVSERLGFVRGGDGLEEALEFGGRAVRLYIAAVSEPFKC